MSGKISEDLLAQYQDIAESIEIDGLGTAFIGGYIQPNTDDVKLNDAITKILDGLDEFNEIMEPYLI